MATPLRRWAARAPELSLALSIAAFLALSSIYAARLPVWHEVVSALPSSGYRVIDPSPARRSEDALPLERSCTEADPPRLVFSASRPNLGLCASGQTLPLMVTSYASGIPTWPLAAAYPLHRDDTFALRTVWLFVAALSLVLLFGLVRRVADRPTAALACAVTAVSTPFVMINALLLPFETLPSTFMVAALALWMPDREGARASSARIAGGALLVGLALASNLKALFFLAPLALLAWRSGARVRGIGASRLGWASVGLAIPLLPIVIFAIVDPHGGFSDQLSMRAHAVTENLTLGRLATEPFMLFNFAADLPSYSDLVQQRGGVPLTFMHVAVGIPLTSCVIAGLSHLAGRPRGSRLAAACGVVIATYFLVSLLLYRQYPGGNYSPLSDVFGVAMAAGCVDGARALSRMLAGRRVPVMAIACALAAVLAIGGVRNLLARIDGIGRVPISTNASIERAMIRYLRSRPDVPIVTTTYNDAGVLDALGRGELRVIDAHDLLSQCDRPDAEDCVRAQLAWLFTRRDALPARIVVPASLVLVDHPRNVIAAIPDALRQASRELGLRARVEKRFRLRDGTVVTELYRVDAPPGWTPPEPEPEPEPEAVVEHEAPTPEPPPITDARCVWQVTPSDAQRIFARLRTIDEDGCVLESVRGMRSSVEVRWQKDGQIGDAVVVGGECAEGRVTPVLEVPDSVSASCPSTLARAREALASETFEGAPAR